RIDDVVHVREIPAHVAVVVHVDRLARHDGIGELVVRDVRSAPRTVYGEETQAGDREPVQMRIGMRHQLVRLLGGGIQRYRGVDAVFRGERQLGVGPVHRRGGGVDQVLDAAVPATFQDGQHAGEVAIQV